MTFTTTRDRLGAWFRRSTNRRILAAILTVGGFSAVVKFAAMTKELVVAYRFGTGDVIDAFLIAFLLPALVVNVVTGSLGAAFTPVYIAVRETQGRSAGALFLRDALGRGCALVVLVSGLLIAASPWLHLLAHEFGPEKLALTRALYFLLLPIVILNAFIAFWSAALNSEGRFAWTAMAPVGVPLVTLGVVVLGARVSGGHALAWGTVFGYVAQCGVLIVALGREKLPVLPRWGPATPELRRVLLQVFPLMGGAALTHGSLVIGQAMAATLSPGSVAALSYGSKLPAVASEIGSMAIATAVLPHFSEMVARRGWGEIRHTLRVYGRLIVAVMIPLTLIGVYLSPSIVRLLFERGAFGPEDTVRVATIQSLSLLQLPFLMVGMLFVRLVTSLQKNQILLLGAALTLPLNVALNVFFIRWLGVAGIALATSAVYAFSSVFLFVAVDRTMQAIERESAGGGAA